MREGNEPDIFWTALGGKAEYASGKEIKGHVEDPHLFLLNITEGRQKVHSSEVLSLKIIWFCPAEIIRIVLSVKTCLIADFGSWLPDPNSSFR